MLVNVAVFTIVVFVGVPTLTMYVAKNTASVPGQTRLEIVQFVVPLLAPDDGFVQVKVGPETCWKSTKVVFAGISSDSATVEAVSGP